MPCLSCTARAVTEVTRRPPQTAGADGSAAGAALVLGRRLAQAHVRAASTIRSALLFCGMTSTCLRAGLLVWLVLAAALLALRTWQQKAGAGLRKRARADGGANGGSGGCWNLGLGMASRGPAATLAGAAAAAALFVIVLLAAGGSARRRHSAAGSGRCALKRRGRDVPACAVHQEALCRALERIHGCMQM